MYLQIKNVELWSEDYYKIVKLLEQNGFNMNNHNCYNDRAFNLLTHRSTNYGQ